MAIQEFDIDEYDSDEAFEDFEAIEEERMYRETQEDDLNHAATMYVLRSQNRYLLREVYLQDMVLDAMDDQSRENRRLYRLRIRELSQLRKAKLRNARIEHAKNKREMESVAGYFYEFLRMTGQIGGVAKDEGCSVDHLCDFWVSVQLKEE